MRLSSCPPNNPIEDRFITLLDLGIRLDERAEELAAIRLQMRLREKTKLKFFLARAKIAEVRK